MISWIMEAGSRYAAFVVVRATKETHLKPPIATGIKGLTVCPILSMIYATQIVAIQKHGFLKALIKTFLPFQKLLIS